jgi:hypothetical protein
MSNGVNAIKGFDYQATVILDRLFDHFDHNGPRARARPEGATISIFSGSRTRSSIAVISKSRNQEKIIRAAERQERGPSRRRATNYCPTPSPTYLATFMNKFGSSATRSPRRLDRFSVHDRTPPSPRPTFARSICLSGMRQSTLQA